mgnify:CR=1 FL=1
MLIDAFCDQLWLQDGLAPAEGNPQFHQQMVYAVASLTIDRFERALRRASDLEAEFGLEFALAEHANVRARPEVHIVATKARLSAPIEY